MKRFLSLAAVLFAAVASFAQERDAPRVEVGAQFTSLSQTQPNFTGTENLPGFGGRLSYNLSDHVAVEGEVNFLPAEPFQSTAAGGRVLQGQFGVKAGKRFERFGVFAKARPGFVSFSRTAVFREGQVTIAGQTFPTVEFGEARRTHLSFDLGGVLEFYPTRRVLVRFDAGDTIVRYRERDDFPSAIALAPQQQQQLLTRLPAETKHNFQFSAGVGLRFGGTDDDANGSPAPRSSGGGDRAPRYEVGVQFTSLTRDLPRERFGFPVILPDDFGTDTETGFGGRFTYNLSDHVAVEAEGNFYPRDNAPGQTFGGFPAQAQFGAKVGKRFERFGVFAKARPGFVTYSRVVQLVGTQQVTFTINPQTGATQTFTVGIFEPRRKTYFSADVGGVVELYPSRRVVTRFDLGDTIVRYGRRDAQGFLLSQNILSVDPETKHNFQFSAGLGFRF